MKQCGVVLALITVLLIFAIMIDGKNIPPTNIDNLVMRDGYVVILAIGMLLRVLIGNIDLGAGSTIIPYGVIAGILMIDCHANM